MTLIVFVHCLPLWFESWCWTKHVNSNSSDQEELVLGISHSPMLSLSAPQVSPRLSSALCWLLVQSPTFPWHAFFKIPSLSAMQHSWCVLVWKIGGTADQELKFIMNLQGLPCWRTCDSVAIFASPFFCKDSGLGWHCRQLLKPCSCLTIFCCLICLSYLSAFGSLSFLACHKSRARAKDSRVHLYLTEILAVCHSFLWKWEQ